MKSKSIAIFTAVILITETAFCQIPSNPKEVEEIQDSSSITHAPGGGFQLVKGNKGSLILSVFATLRYLNSTSLEDSATDHLGRTKSIDQRNDLQFQKVTLYFRGFVFDPDLTYLAYVWSSNTSQGQGAQVVLGGNLQYRFNKHLQIGAGIGALPTNRSLYGQWPLWLRQDARPMAEEYFRGSFTTGIWAQGAITNGLFYKTMLGNNLSQLGIDAGQLDDGFDTWSTALMWVTNNHSRIGSYGDYAHHVKPATWLSVAYSRSNETRQSQPGTESPENSQIRISDGTGVFALDAFVDGSQVTAAKYEMANIGAGLKYKGFSLDVDYFMRWVSKFESVGQPIPVSDLFDNGYNLQGSAMIINKVLQVYGVYSYINGEYGKPSEVNIGLNWFPFRNRSLRINPEFIVTKNSPVGYLSYPTVVGAKGNVYMINLELYY